MLSILIPTYDFVCYPLVHSLYEQAEALGISYEIIVVEDGGRDQVKAIANHKINDLPHCRYLRRKENVGRAAIRNYLAREAQGEYMLFIDDDAQVENPSFLATYMQAAELADVVVGGLYHAAECADPMRSLRHRYERDADARRSAAMRSEHPYTSLSTFNILIRRSVFLEIGFDEDCHEYGYEDALFGVELKERGVAIKHIDNALLHTGIDTNIQFLQKTKTALRTLASLKGKMRGNSRIENTYLRFCHYHMAWLLRLAFVLSGNALANYLTKSAKPSLRLFALYKLLYFAHLRP